MSEEPTDLALERLTEETAAAMIFTLQPGATTGDPKPAIVQLLRRYLAAVQAQAFEAALREQHLEEHDQQN